MSLTSVVGTVVDPELQVVTIEELGILRSVFRDPDTGRITVAVTPTYVGCPAMDAIRADIRAVLARAGHTDVEVMTVLRPAWSTDMITEAGRAKLAAARISPPAPSSPTSPGSPASPTSPGSLPWSGSGPVPVALSVRCVHCGSLATEELSRFGSTACKSLWRCRVCGEPFDRMKTL